MKLYFIVGLLICSLFFALLFVKALKKNKLRKRVLSEGVSDYKSVAQNIALSISKSKDLYKSLIVKVHPDKFIEEKKEEATELSTRITMAKKNYEELTRLKIEVEQFLNKK
jgi:hypothetical protein